MKSFKNPFLILPSRVTWSCKVVRLGSSLPSWQIIFYVMKCFKMCSRWLIAMRRRHASRHRRTNYGYVRTMWGSKTLEDIWGHNRTYRNVLLSRTSTNMASFGFLFGCLCDEHGIQWAPIFFFFPPMRDANYADRHPCIGVWRHRREEELDRCKTPSNSSAGKTRTPSRQHRIHWKTVCKQLISPFLDNMGSGKEEFSERIVLCFSKSGETFWALSERHRKEWWWWGATSGLCHCGATGTRCLLERERGGIIVPLLLLHTTPASVWRGSIGMNHFGWKKLLKSCGWAVTGTPQFHDWLFASVKDLECRCRMNKQTKCYSALADSDKDLMCDISHIGFLPPFVISSSSHCLCSSHPLSGPLQRSCTLFSGSLLWQETLPPLLIIR